MTPDEFKLIADTVARIREDFTKPLQLYKPSRCDPPLLDADVARWDDPPGDPLENIKAHFQRTDHPPQCAESMAGIHAAGLVFQAYLWGAAKDAGVEVPENTRSDLVAAFKRTCIANGIPSPLTMKAAARRVLESLGEDNSEGRSHDTRRER